MLHNAHDAVVLYRRTITCSYIVSTNHKSRLRIPRTVLKALRRGLRGRLRGILRIGETHVEFAGGIHPHLGRVLTVQRRRHRGVGVQVDISNQNFERGCTFKWLKAMRFQIQGQPDVFNLHRLTVRLADGDTPVATGSIKRSHALVSGTGSHAFCCFW